MRNSSARIRKTVFMAIITTSLLVLANPAFSNVRIVHLDGTTNTRDIGGYLTSDMETVRWGQIIRSDKLSRLTDNDFRKLEEMGVKTVIDLRTNKENKQSPTVWKGDNPPEFFHFPVGDVNNDWFRSQRSMMRKNRFTQEKSMEHMVEGYQMIADEGTSSYQQLMEVVLDESNWPILIHCTAGKDRSGVAIALILEAMGVERETIMEEYLLTNKISRVEEKAAYLAKESKKASMGNRSPSASAWLPIVGVDAQMLEAFYASVDEDYGSMDAFLTELGVDQDARDALTASLTTPPAQMVNSEQPQSESPQMMTSE